MSPFCQERYIESEQKRFQWINSCKTRRHIDSVRSSLSISSTFSMSLLQAEDLASLVSNLLTSVLRCPARPTGVDRGQQMTHQPSTDISVFFQWTASTSPVLHVTHTNTETPARKHTAQLNAESFSPSVIASGCACSSSHMFTRVCLL